MEVFIRKAEINDSKSISQLSDELGYLSSNAAIQERLTEIFKNAGNCVYVAVDKTKVAGWIHGFSSLRVESDPFVEIGGLVVSENYRKKGLGKMLVNEVIKWAKSQRYYRVRVRCNVLRAESHRFYENIGFDLKKEQKIFDKRLF